MKIKALLIQIRQNPAVIEEERRSFAVSSGLPLEQIHTFNVFDNESFDFHLLSTYDCLFVGGASEASVLKPVHYPFVPSLINLLKECLNQDFPVFASCFGFQAAILAMGGEIIRDETNFEMGTYRMKLSKATEHDPIFSGIPNGFYAISVHQEKCLELPDDCIKLAETESCIHSFRVKDKPFWAFQFHPELTKQNLISRLAAYQDQYTQGDSHYQNIINSLVETPESNRLVANFVKFLNATTKTT